MTTTDANVRDATTSTGRRGAAEPRQEKHPEGLFSLVRERIKTELNERKNVVSQTLDGVAETVRRVGAPLREQSVTLGGYADDAAGRLQALATDLRSRDLSELAEDVKEVARKYPGAFIAAGLAAGVLTARFLKSSGGAEAGSASRRGERSRGGMSAAGAGPTVARGTGPREYGTAAGANRQPARGTTRVGR